MATIKAFSDLEQSKKLTEILPLESADMEYLCLKETNATIGSVPFVKDDSEVENSAYDAVYEMIPCWSLAALLNIIPKQIKGYNVLRIDISEDFAIWYDEIGCRVNTELPDITMECPVDACYETILKLKENNLL